MLEEEPMVTSLDFEKNFSDLEDKLLELKRFSAQGDKKAQEEFARLEKKTNRLMAKTYAKLTPWQKVLVARHLDRPHTKDYVQRLMEDFIPLSGDRCFGEDPAILSGLASFRGLTMMVMGHEKGHETKERLHHNFGMARPEGYRKVLRLMDLAEKFYCPVVCFVDTPGAYAGVEAEERGQFQAIATCIEKSFQLSVPLISIIIGEGGSGGAIALATSNTVIMLEHAVYSVISPEGCSSILWRTRDRRQEAAAALKITAQDLLQLNVINHIVPEPLGGAHRHPLQTIDDVGNVLEKNLDILLSQTPKAIKQHRRSRFLKIGQALL